MKCRSILFAILVSNAFVLSPTLSRADRENVCDSRPSFQLLRCVKALIDSERWMSAVQFLEELRLAEERSEVRSAVADCEQAQREIALNTTESEDTAREWLLDHPFAKPIHAVLDSFVLPIEVCSAFSVGMPVAFGLLGQTRSGVRHCVSTRFDQWLEQTGEFNLETAPAILPSPSSGIWIKPSTFSDQGLLVNYKYFEYTLDSEANSEEWTDDTSGSGSRHSVKAALPFFPLRASRKQATHTCRFLREEL